MSIGTVIKEARERYGVSQEDMKGIIHYSRETLSKIETGQRRLPEDTLPRLARWSPMVALEIAAEHTGGTLPLIRLDGDIDRHPVAMTQKAIEEGGEFLDSARELRLINKTSRDKLTTEDREKFMAARLEAWEDVICKLEWLTETAEVYGFDMAEEHRQVVGKLEAAGYKKPEKKKTASKAAR